MTEAEWLTGPIPGVMIFVEDLPGPGSRYMIGKGRKQVMLLLALARLYWRYLGPRSRMLLEAMQREEEDPPGTQTTVGMDDLEGTLSNDVDKAPEYVQRAGLDYLRWLFTWVWKDIAGPPQLDPDWRPTIQDVFGNPFRPVTFDPSCRTSTILTLAAGIYADRAFDRLPILADALQDAGCDNLDILNHCRGGGVHVRGCWVVDQLLGKS
jgi:hypothetical protein